MATEIYGNAPYSTQLFSLQGATIEYKSQASQVIQGETVTVDEQSTIPLACEGFRIQYARTPTNKFSISGGQGTLKRYRAYGAPNGTLVLNGIFGPKTTIQTFLGNIGSPCYTWTFIITPASADCNTATNLQNTDTSKKTKTSNVAKIYIYGASMNLLDLNYTVGQNGIATVQFPLQLQFTKLEWADA